VYYGLQTRGQEIEASRLVGLTVLILLTHHPFAGKEEKLPQIMKFFAFVELRMDTPAQGFIFEIAQDENGFDKSSRSIYRNL
jgi:hypothetical protein